MTLPEKKLVNFENTVKSTVKSIVQGSLFDQSIRESKCWKGIDTTKGIGLPVLRKEKERSLANIREEIKGIIDRLPDNRLTPAFAHVKNLQELPDDELAEYLTIIEKFAEKAKRDLLPELPEKPSEDQLYQLGDDLMGHLEKTWAPYLTYFNDINEKPIEVDILYQDYLWEHDPVFMRKLYDKLRREHKKDTENNPRPQDVIKRRADRITMEVKEFTKDKEKEFRRLYSAKTYRAKHPHLVAD